MSVEAELKARLRDPARVRELLGQRAAPEPCVYHDRYFDFPDRRWSDDGHELRVRVITDAHGTAQSFLTFKQPAVDVSSGSKPEHESAVADPDVITTVITALGLVEVIAFEKVCTNYRWTASGREVLATVVEVPELDGVTFLEVETIAEDAEVSTALDVVRSVLDDLDVNADQLTQEQYTDAVAKHRSSGEWSR